MSSPVAVRSESRFARIPSVDRLLRDDAALALIARHGRTAVVDAVRATLDDLRDAMASARIGAAERAAKNRDPAAILQRASSRLSQQERASPRPVFNLTGTVLHTNLGRAVLPEEAIEAIADVARNACDLEFDLASGARGERDEHVEAQLCRLTGAQAATVVNNNAAAVLLVLNSLANRREVPTSRGELIEIGGSFRLPDIMARAGCRLREVGTTNRTHLRDFADAIGARTGAVMKVHTSNYEIHGFTTAPDEAELAALCRERGVPFVVDIGSGSLVDLQRFGLPHEPTPIDALRRGADVVTFSGDKLLGGPQAGIVVGRADLIERIRRNPLKRALRVDKMTIAALSVVLRLYADPERLVQRLPTLRWLQRPAAEVRALAARLLPDCAAALGASASASVVDCQSQVGSGAQPSWRIASAGIAIRPHGPASRGGTLNRIAAAFRRLPVPVIGRIHDGAFLLDLRCLDDESGLRSQLVQLRVRARDDEVPASPA